MNIERIPLWVESQRGDDRFGTNPDGKVISDFEAKQQGVPFTEGVPKENIKTEIEKQLKDDKWVVIEQKDGNTELLTKKDIPLYEGRKEPEQKKDNVTQYIQAVTPAPTIAPTQEPVKEDWREAFGIKQTPTPTQPITTAQQEPPKEPQQKPPKPKSCCSTTTSTPASKESWESKFEGIKSATAVNPAKGG